MAIKITAGGKIVTKGGLPSCACCEQFELAIKYDWSGTGQYDLDTQTAAFGESCGWGPVDEPCGSYGTYVLWLAGGDGDEDDTSVDGFERVNVKVDTARVDELWTSSYNIECYAGWFSGGLGVTNPIGSGPALLEATYKGDTKSATIYPGEQDVCASTSVATITVYADALGDGTFFEITVT